MKWIDEMTVKKKSVLSLAILLAVAGCKNDAKPAQDDDAGTTVTGQVQFSQLNFESEAKFIGPRLHAVLSEVYRNLELIYLALQDDGETVAAKMLAASGPPIDDLLFINLNGANDMTAIAPDASGNPIGFEACTNTGGGITTQFIDRGAAGFDAGDRILRDFNNTGCDYDFVDASGNSIVTDDSRPAHWPQQMTGSILYEFTGGTGAGSAFVGTATLGDPDPLVGLNLDMTGGLLNADNNSSTESFNGSVTFDIDFATGAAEFTNISVRLSNGTASVTSPATITVGTVERAINDGGVDRVTITNGSIVSEVSGQQITFATQEFNPDPALPNPDNFLSGPTGGFPNRGAIVFEGANNTAVRVRTDIDGFSGLVELDIDGDDAFDDAPEAELNGWAWFVYGFLMLDKAPQFD